MIGQTVKFHKWHHSNSGLDQVTYTGQVVKELANNALFVRVTAVKVFGHDIASWGYTKVNKSRLVEA